MLVRARLLGTAEPPSAEDLGAYIEGLVVYRWRIEDVLAGELDADEILVGQYASLL